MYRERSIFMKIIQDWKYILYLSKMQMHIPKKMLEFNVFLKYQSFYEFNKKYF